MIPESLVNGIEWLEWLPEAVVLARRLRRLLGRSMTSGWNLFVSKGVTLTLVDDIAALVVFAAGSAFLREVCLKRVPLAAERNECTPGLELWPDCVDIVR